MVNNFEITGKLIGLKGKESNSFIETKKFDSGWTISSVDFLVVSGDNSVRCRVQGGKFADDSKNSVKTITAKKRNEDGTVTDSEKITIAWDDRFNPENVDKVAGYRKSIFSLSDRDKLREMRFAKKALNDGNMTDELKKYDFKTIEEADEKIDREAAKTNKFIAEWDFVQLVGKFFANNAKPDGVFKVTGTYDVQYSIKTNKPYATYHVTRIIKVSDDEEQNARFNNLRVFVPKDFIDDSDLADSGKAMICGQIEYYDSMVKKNGFTPMNISIYGNQRKIDYFKSKTENVESEICAFDMIVDIVNSTSYREITEDDLTEEELMDIEFGVRTFEAIKAARSGRIAGDRITEMRFVSLTTGEVIQTEHTEADMHPAVAQVISESEDDLFDDEDDLFD